MQKTHLGLIGAWGLRGATLRHALLEPNVEIIAAADIYEDSLEQCQNYYAKLGQNIETSRDYHTVLQNPKIDGVFIASPDYAHFEHAKAALEAGKHVYLEKPLAISVEDCDNLLETACRTKTKLFLGHNMRYFPAVLKMKEIIDSGMIGEVQAVWCRHFVNYGGEAYFKDWHSERQYSNGLLLQKGAHDIDVIHWLCGAYSQKVVGMGKLSVYDKSSRRSDSGERYFPLKAALQYPPQKDRNFSPHIDVEDHNMIFMQLENGIQASYMHCMYAPTSERNYVFMGTKGKLENIGDMGDCEIHVYTELRDYRRPNIIHKIGGDSGEHGGADPEIMRAFVRFIRDEAIPNTSPIAARMAVAAGIAGTESIRNGSVPIDVAQLDPKLEAHFGGAPTG
ncbi:MAG: Gfo/Idh/MocA family oxidoreductase [Spirochaetota bacterium]